MFIPVSLVDYLIFSAEKYPNKMALKFGEEKLTYFEINKRTDLLANRLCEMGLQRGDRIISCLDNRVEAILVFWAALKANAVISIVHPGIARQKLIYIIQDAGAKILFIKEDVEFLEQIKQNKNELNNIIVLDKKSDHKDTIDFNQLLQGASVGSPKRLAIDIDLAAIIYTSGSTGLPKGVMLTHRAMIAASASICSYLKLNYDDIIISALPLSFDYGLYQVILSFLAGSTLVLEKDFTWPISFLKKLSEEKATIFPGVATMFSILANHVNKISYDGSSIRCVTNTGTTLLQKHINLIKLLFPLADIYSMYGLTECKRCTYLPPDYIDKKPNSVGIAIPNTEIWVVDEHNNKLGPKQIGQLVIRGGTVMQGYWNKPLESEKVLKKGNFPGEKVLYTGDYGYLDESGYFYFFGRMDEVIKRYGEKVSLREIEETIYLLPEVLETAVIDLPDEMLGSTVIAFVGSRKEIKNSVMQHCKKTLPKSHWPQEIVVFSELPKNINGKLDKVALKEWYLQSVSIKECE